MIETIKIGILSDSHGLLRPKAVDILTNCDYIIHAGDICSELIIEELNSISNLVAVSGNVDRSEYTEIADRLDFTKILDLGFARFYHLS
jgi:putative phosphoesterase